MTRSRRLPSGSRPLTEREDEHVFEAGYEAASYHQDQPYLDRDGLFLWAIKHDRRLPKKLNESDPKFWSYHNTFVDGLESFAESAGLEVIG